ncbi:NADPH oxidase activator 1, partial [Cuculus canorus]
RDSESGYYRVVSHYCPEDSEKLEVKAGSLVFVLARGADGWATAIHDGQKLHIPTSLLEPASKMDKWKISNGIPLPPAQVPPSRLPMTQKPGSSSVGVQSHVQPRYVRSMRQRRSLLTTSAVLLFLFCSSESPGRENTSAKDAGAQMDFKVRSKGLPTSVPSPLIRVLNNQTVHCRVSQQMPPTGGDASSSTERPVVLRARCECTVVLRAGEVPSLPELRALLREHFGQQAERGKLSYRHSDGKELGAVSDEEDLGKVWQQLTDGGLTLCCQDSDSCSGRPVLYRMLAQHPYLAQGPGDLEFSKGDVLYILSEVNEDWLEGCCNGKTGIFPKCFANQTS